MDSISKILKSPFYFGEISEEETKIILMKEPPHSYLFRRKTDGTITLATLFDYLDRKELIDFEYFAGTCFCNNLPKSKVKPMRFQNFADAGRFCYGLTRGKEVRRKNPLPLVQTVKTIVATNFKNSIDELELPKNIKDDLKILKKEQELPCKNKPFRFIVFLL